MTRITTWTHDKQLEMLQLINYSYEMTAACLGGKHIKDWLSMHYGNFENMSYVSGSHFKNLNTLEHQDGNFYYTDRPRSLSTLLKYSEGPDDGICDPTGDPYPANVGQKRAEKGESAPDPLEGELRDYEWVGRFSDYGAVEGNIFRKNGAYYMVFDGSELRDWWSDWIDADGGILTKNCDALKDPLEEAYRIYRKAKKRFKFNEKNVVFVGHSLGGGLAAALSAGIALGAFEEKEGTNDDWSFVPDRIYRPDKTPEPLQDHVPALTFNAPQMGWLFDKFQSVTGGYRVPHREERLNDVDVMTIRTNRDPVSGLRLYGGDGKHTSNRYMIGGRLMTLGDTVGRLDAYFEDEVNRRRADWGRKHLPLLTDKELLDSQSGLFFWHGTNTLELALMDKVEEEEPKEPDPPQVRVDPLILDLNRDGKVSTTPGKRYFDLDANGIAERASWAASGDGFLAMDRDGDGKITSGLELFGDHTVMSDGRVASSGFQALADLDSNKDGKIDASDEAFGRLRIWSDKNGDGKFGDEELSSLAETGIESLDLRYAEQRTEDENGNQIVRTGRFAWSDGERGKVSEFLLERDTAHALVGEKLDEPDEVAALPDLPERGFLYSLHQAMVRDGSGELKRLTEEFVEERDSVERRSLLDRILLKWSEVSDAVSVPHDGWLGFMKKFYGNDRSYGTPTSEGWRELQRNYERISQYLYGSLLQQSHYAEMLATLESGLDESGNIRIYIGDALEELVREHAGDPDQAKRSIGEFFLALKSAGLYGYVGESEAESAASELSRYGRDFSDACRASYLAMSRPVGTYALPVFGSESGGVLEGTHQNDVLVGGRGSDVLKGGHGSDVILSGAGSDVLEGGADSDVYVWNLGDGDDRIVNSSTGSGEEDVLRLGKGIHAENVSVERYGNTIRLRIGESGEVLTLGTDTSLNGSLDALDPVLQLSRIEFSDGTVWSREYLLGSLVEFSGTDEDDILEGSVGDDVLSGGKGDDVLRGGRGSDTYVWSPGDGADTIIAPVSGDEANALRFGDGVTPDGLTFRSNGRDLEISLKASGETLTVSNWYGRQKHKLARLEFADGSILTSAEVDELVGSFVWGTDGSDVLYDDPRSTEIVGGRGDDVLNGGNGGDVYIWNLGDGSDTIVNSGSGGSKNVLRFGVGVGPEDVSLRSEGGDLLVSVGASGETIVVKDWFMNHSRRLTSFEFADGTVWDQGKIESLRGKEIVGTDGAETLNGSYVDDVLAGGKGDDVLVGSNGNDVYVWNLGDGSDTIRDTSGSNVLQFGEGIAPEDIKVIAKDWDLFLEVDGERIRILDWLRYQGSALSGVRFPDGTVWSAADLNARLERVVMGTDGNDVLDGMAWDDTFVGGKGDDELRGGEGNDTYVWNPGDGNDHIVNGRGGRGVLKFGEGVSPEDVQVSASGADLVFTFKGTGETITIRNWRQGKALSRVEFSDGTFWKGVEIDANVLRGTDGEDVLIGMDHVGETLIGGHGDDVLRGGGGSDVYVWNLGDGNDRISDQKRSSWEVNVLRFGEGIAPADVAVTAEGENLVFFIGRTGERVTVENWRYDRFSRMDRVEFADGTIWNAENIPDGDIVDVDNSNVLVGTSRSERLIGGSGDDALYGGGGDDTYVWNPGDGNDRILDFQGTTTLRIGEGVDPQQVVLRRQGAALIVEMRGSGEKITIDDWHKKSEEDTFRIHFADGTTWSQDDIAVMMPEITGTNGNDRLVGTDWDDHIRGLQGDDLLEGGKGSDTYVWNRGDGNDRILDLEGRSVLQLGPGILSSHLNALQDGDDLVLMVDGKDGGSIRLRNWVTNEDMRFCEIRIPDSYTKWGYEDIKSELLQTGNASSGSEWIKGGSDDDVLNGQEGDDIIDAGAGDDTLVGGKGDDILNGENGNDIYLWTVGDGNDVIRDGAGKNTLRLEGIVYSPETVKFTLKGDDLVVSVGEGDRKECITIRQWQARGGYRCRIQIGETSFAPSDINAMLSKVAGTDGDDVLLSGGGNDTLVGGKGDDVLDGGFGNDTYIWNLGDGNDTIIDGRGAENLAFGEGISPDSVRVERDERHMYFNVGGSRIKFENWFWENGEAVDWYKGRPHLVSFADGTVWDRWSAEYGTQCLVGTDGDDTLQSYGYRSSLTGGKGDDILNGSTGHDKYIWNIGDGNDVICDGYGYDELHFGGGVTPDSVHVEQDGGDLCFVIGDERITVRGWSGNKDYQHSFIVRFAGGGQWSSWELRKRARQIVGTDGDDTLGDYYNMPDSVLTGKKGNDILQGGRSRDTYIWDVGDGNDTIMASAGPDRLKFGAGVRQEMVRFESDERNLYVLVGDERITLKDWFALGDFVSVQEILFPDGSAWSREDILARACLHEGTDAGETIRGHDLTPDILTGHGGKDILMGGGNDDTYVWNLGDGHDTVVDNTGRNVLVLGAGVDESAVSLGRVGNDLHVFIGEEGITIKNYFGVSAAPLSEIRFADGSVWNSEAIVSKLPSSQGAEAGVMLQGTSGDDVLLGNFLDNVIYGDEGNDRIVGGSGRDRLDGGAGDDTYVWKPGDGDDTITDLQGRNVLELAGDIIPGDVEVMRDSSDLWVRHKTSGERVRIQGWFSGGRLAEIRFSDGTSWSTEYVDALCGNMIGTEASDSLIGYATDDSLSGLGGDDLLSGLAGNDTLVGGRGEDRLYGGAGNDVYIWEVGDGSDRIRDGDGTNILRLGATISAADVGVSRDADSLYFLMPGGDRICIENWFRAEHNRLALVEFSDGTRWDAGAVESLLPASGAVATDEDDTLQGTPESDVLDGLGGDDVIHGGAGDDILVGGKGQDRLYGDGGDDTYTWNLGDGNDVIVDAAGRNRLKFGIGVDRTMVRVVPYGMDLVVRVGSGDESVRIADWFKDGSNKLSEIVFADGTVWSRKDIDGKIRLLEGTEGADTLNGSAMADLLLGREGDDAIHGQEGDDSLVGGKGNDNLRGGAGNDSYIWNPGDGDDTLYDVDGVNVVQIGEGIDPSRAEIRRDGNNLILVLSQTGEKLNFTDWYGNARTQFAEIRFADGTVWSRAEINAMLPVFHGTDEGEMLRASKGSDRIYGYGGNDEIYAGAGNDTLVGGAGNDTLYGEAGDDTYVWGIGDGNDTIDDVAGINTLKIGSGILPQDVVLKRTGKNEADLTFVMGRSGEQVTVLKWFSAQDSQLSRIEFSDGTVWSRLQVMDMIGGSPEGGEGDDILNGSYLNDTLMGRGGDDALYGHGGRDTLSGGMGNDLLEGGEGDDTYIWNIGDGEDTLSDGSGRNILRLGEGLSPDAIQIRRVGRDLSLVAGTDGERVTIRDWYYSAANRLAEIHFADGTIWTPEQINAIPPVWEAPRGGGSVSGSTGDDLLCGRSGNDSLYGNAGNDVLEGKKGDDYLDGGRGDDTYVWNPGDGRDTLYDYNGRNVLKIGEGVDPTKVEASRDGSNLYLTVTETGEKLTLKDWCCHSAYRLSEIRFFDGTVWSAEDIGKLPLTLRAPASGGTVSGYDTDDTLLGSANADSLYGNSGNDVLEGKKGDDYLDGGRGDDTYVWNAGDGNDTLYDYNGKNVLKIGEGVDPTKVKASRDGRNLYLTLPETGERLTLKDWYYGAAYRLSEIRFADGTVWSTQDVEDIASGAKPAFAASFDAEIEQSLTMLSAPSFASTLRGGLCEGVGESFGGWERDPSLAAIMNGTSDAGEDAASFEVARLGMDVALAQLSFETPSAGLVCDPAAPGSVGMESVKLSVSTENGLEKHFKEGVRHAGQSRNF